MNYLLHCIIIEIFMAIYCYRFGSIVYQVPKENKVQRESEKTIPIHGWRIRNNLFLEVRNTTEKEQIEIFIQIPNK